MDDVPDLFLIFFFNSRPLTIVFSPSYMWERAHSVLIYGASIGRNRAGRIVDDVPDLFLIFFLILGP